MYGNHRGGPRTDRRGYGLGIKAVTHRVYVGVDRESPGEYHAFGHIDIAERGHDDLVACSDTCGAQQFKSPHTVQSVGVP